MGCFTSIYKDGVEYQIYGGDDTCKRYNVGDKVDSYVMQSYKSGHLLDNIYESYTEDESKRYYVVIENSIAVSIESIRKQLIHENDDEYDLFFENEYNNIKNKYSFKEYPDSLWSEKSKIEYEQRIQDSEKRINELIETIKDLSYAEKLGKLLAYPLTIRHDYSKIKNGFTVEPLDVINELNKKED